VLENFRMSPSIHSTFKILKIFSSQNADMSLSVLLTYVYIQDAQ
jgi:hypothetical protein